MEPESNAVHPAERGHHEHHRTCGAGRGFQNRRQPVFQQRLSQPGKAGRHRSGGAGHRLRPQRSRPGSAHPPHPAGGGGHAPAEQRKHRPGGGRHQPGTGRQRLPPAAGQHRQPPRAGGGISGHLPHQRGGRGDLSGQHLHPRTPGGAEKHAHPGGHRGPAVRGLQLRVSRRPGRRQGPDRTAAAPQRPNCCCAAAATAPPTSG